MFFFLNFTMAAVGHPISLLTPKTAPPCPSKDLRGPAPGHPEVFRVNPDLPRHPKRWDPPSGSPGTPSLVQMKSTLTRPAFPGTFEALPRGTQRSTESTPTCPVPWNVGVPPRGPWAGPCSGHTMQQHQSCEQFHQFLDIGNAIWYSLSLHVAGFLYCQLTILHVQRAEYLHWYRVSHRLVPTFYFNSWLFWWSYQKKLTLQF